MSAPTFTLSISNIDRPPVCYSDYMLSELLTMHRLSIVQLHRERIVAFSDAEFLTETIDRHEHDAAHIEALLEDMQPMTA
jgi:hypothetical protein